jgi:acyl dehydratase
MTHISTLRDKVGHELGVSEWFTIDQDKINTHAQNTGDDVWVHTDANRAAAEGAFGSTIAQSSLIISHLSSMFRTLEIPDEGVEYLISYGYDRMRIVQPVPSGSRVRGRFELKKLEPRGHHGLVAYLDAAVEIEDDDIAPALVAEWLIYIRLAD